MPARKRRPKPQSITLLEGVVIATCIFFWVVLFWTAISGHLPIGW